MNLSEKIDLLHKKASDDYILLRSDWFKCSKLAIVNDAYMIAHLNEISDFFDNLDGDNLPFDELIVDLILASDKNIISQVYNSWLSYNHQERYNFFVHEDLTDIVLWTFKRMNS